MGKLQEDISFEEDYYAINNDALNYLSVYSIVTRGSIIDGGTGWPMQALLMSIALAGLIVLGSLQRKTKQLPLALVDDPLQVSGYRRAFDEKD